MSAPATGRLWAVTAPRGSTSGPTPVDWPLQRLVDLLARRHGLAAYWELRAGSLPFRTLGQRVAAPEAQLSQRLRELREGGLVEVDEVGDYRLTVEGRRLLGILQPLADYAERWDHLTPRQRTPRGSAGRGRGEDV